MKTTVNRHGFARHGFNPENVVCPDCNSDSSCLTTISLHYIDSKYRITYECNECFCSFEIETNTLKQFD